MKNYIISEKQLEFLLEQSAYQPYWAQPLTDFTWKWCRTDLERCSSTAQVLVWFVPYVGPYLSAALGLNDSYNLFKKGKTAEGIISLLFSPLAISKLLLALRVLKVSGPFITYLQKINKTGLPLAYAKSGEAFFNWLYNDYVQYLLSEDARDALNGKKLTKKDAVADLEKLKIALNDDKLQDETLDKLKKSVMEWKTKHSAEYNKLSPKEKKVIEDFLKL